MDDENKKRRQPTLEDLTNLMVLHQYALAIEKRSVELYWTDPERFEELAKILKGVLDSYKGVATPYLQDPPDSCHPLVLCRDGTCAAEGDCC